MMNGFLLKEEAEELKKKVQENAESDLGMELQEQNQQ